MEGVACTILGLAIQFDSDSDRLSPEGMHNALFGLQHHILRIAEDVGKMEAGKGTDE